MVHCNIGCWYGASIFVCFKDILSFRLLLSKVSFVGIIFFLVFQNTSSIAFAWKSVSPQIQRTTFCLKKCQHHGRLIQSWKLMKTSESDESRQRDENFRKWWKLTTRWKVRKVMKVDNLMKSSEGDESQQLDEWARTFQKISTWQQNSSKRKKRKARKT